MPAHTCDVLDLVPCLFDADWCLRSDVTPDLRLQAHSTKEERVASIMEGREGRGKFGIKKGHEGGTTNKMKDKRKNPKMIAYARRWLGTETLCPTVGTLMLCASVGGV